MTKHLVNVNAIPHRLVSDPSFFPQIRPICRAAGGTCVAKQRGVTGGRGVDRTSRLYASVLEQPAESHIVARVVQ